MRLRRHVTYLERWVRCPAVDGRPRTRIEETLESVVRFGLTPDSDEVRRMVAAYQRALPFLQQPPPGVPWHQGERLRASGAIRYPVVVVLDRGRTLDPYVEEWADVPSSLGEDCRGRLDLDHVREILDHHEREQCCGWLYLHVLEIEPERWHALDFHGHGPAGSVPHVPRGRTAAPHTTESPIATERGSEATP